MQLRFSMLITLMEDHVYHEAFLMYKYGTSQTAENLGELPPHFMLAT